MAGETVSRTPGTPESQPRRVMFKPFDWHSDDVRHRTILTRVSLDLSGKVRDVADGVRVVLRIAEADSLNGEYEEAEGDELPSPRLLGVPETAQPMRMCIASLDMLTREAERFSDWVAKYGPREESRPLPQAVAHG